MNSVLDLGFVVDELVAYGSSVQGSGINVDADACTVMSDGSWVSTAATGKGGSVHPSRPPSQ
jgi:hypothetical protein